jgi:hypothetical protein
VRFQKRELSRAYSRDIASGWPLQHTGGGFLAGIPALLFLSAISHIYFLFSRE